MGKVLKQNNILSSSCSCLLREFCLFSIVSTFRIGLPLDGPMKLISRPNIPCKNRHSQGSLLKDAAIVACTGQSSQGSLLEDPNIAACVARCLRVRGLPIKF